MANMAFGSTLQPINGKRQRLTVNSTVASFDPTKYTVPETDKLLKKVAGGVMMQVTGSDEIYWTIDGTDPSSTVGFKNSAGDILYLDSYQKVAAFKVLRVTTDTSIEAVFLFGN